LRSVSQRHETGGRRLERRDDRVLRRQPEAIRGRRRHLRRERADPHADAVSDRKSDATTPGRWFRADSSLVALRAIVLGGIA